MKYIMEKDGKYCIKKYINGRLYSYGVYDRLIDAQRVRDLLIELDWGHYYDKPRVNPMRYIQKVNVKGKYSYYLVQKRFGKKLLWNSSHKTLEEAMCERDLLEANNWDVDLL